MEQFLSHQWRCSGINHCIDACCFKVISTAFVNALRDLDVTHSAASASRFVRFMDATYSGAEGFRGIGEPFAGNGDQGFLYALLHALL
jgi:hypothetical protein